MISTILFSFFLIFIVIGVPIAVSLGLSTIIVLLVSNPTTIQIVAQRMFSAMDSFTLLAIPLFMIAGAIMERGGISKRLIRLANTLVGSFYGGFALVTILASAFFAAISGSSPATVVAIGSIMISAMVTEGYDEDFSVATQVSAGYVGVIIPPSIPLITFGVATGTSISGLFMAGFTPGILIAILLGAIAYFTARKNNWRGLAKKSTLSETIDAFKEAIWAILMPVIIMGGIYGGIFTPTEAANVAVVYGLIVGLYVYKELKFNELPALLMKSGITASVVLLIIAAASTFGLILTREQIPNKVAEALIGFSDNPIIFLLLINIMFLIVGTFMEANASIIILAPILYPAVVKLGIDPVHFGIIMIVNLAIGNITPPLGVNLFVAGGMRNMPIEKIVRANWGYMGASIIALLLITYFPTISMWLPNLLSR